MSEDVRWLTYDEVARDLGITRESARQLAIRKRWARQRGNDGKARIGVPEEEFQARTSDSTSPPPSDDTGHDPSAVRVLERHISRLEAELQALKEERDALYDEREAERAQFRSEADALRAELEAERLRSAQVDALQAVIEAERQRIEDLRADRDRWSAQADKLAVPPDPQPEKVRGWWPWRRRA